MIIAEMPRSELKRETLGENEGRHRRGCVRRWEVGTWGDEGKEEEDGTLRMSE